MSSSVAVNLLLGTFGMAITCYGIRLPEIERARPLFIGCVALLIVALIERHWTFAALEVVMLVGIAVGTAQIGKAAKAAVPIVAGLATIAALYLAGQLTTFDGWVGAFGLVTLTIGYATMHPVAYFSGSLILVFYALLGLLDGVWIAAFWGIMNIIFCWIAAQQIRQLYSGALSGR